MNAQTNEFKINNKTYIAVKPIDHRSCTGCDFRCKETHYCIAPDNIRCKGVIFKEKKNEKKYPVFYTALLSVIGTILFTYGIFELIKFINNLIK